MHQMAKGRARIVLLPGMDGTGDLFADFVAALPIGIEERILRYPPNRTQSYTELLRLLDSFVSTSAPFVLFAESFSVPLAIEWAAQGKPNLKGLILSSGFASSPLQGCFRRVCLLLSRVVFSMPLPASVRKSFLVGREASDLLAARVRLAVRSVTPEVLADRLKSLLECDSRTALGKVEVPVLLIQPMEDRLLSAHCIKSMKEMKPLARVESISGPHLLLQAKPKETAELVANFIEQVFSV